MGFRGRHRGTSCLGGVFTGICLGSMVRHGHVRGSTRVGVLISILTSTVNTPAGPSGVTGAFTDRHRVDCAGGAVSRRVSFLTSTFLVRGTRHCSVGKHGCVNTGLGCCFASLNLHGTQLGFHRRRPARVVRGVICGRLYVHKCRISMNVIRTFNESDDNGHLHGRLRISFIIGRTDRQCCVRITCSLASRRGRTRRFGSLHRVPSSFGGVVVMGNIHGP